MKGLFAAILTVTATCVSIGRAEAPLTYHREPFSGPDHRSFAPNLGYATPSSYSSPAHVAASRVYVPAKTYLQPYSVDKYGSRDGAFGVTAENAYRDDHYSEPSRYGFHYNVEYHGTQFGHKEYKDGQLVKGQYAVLLPDGQRQIVDYVADGHGYRPSIRYESEGLYG